MRRLGAFTLTLAVVAGMAGVAFAQQQANPMDPIIDFFQSNTGREYAARFLENPTPGASTVSDPVGDLEHSSGQEPGYTPAHLDIVDTWIVEFDPGPLDFFTPTDANSLWAPTGQFRVEPPTFEDFFTYTGGEEHDGTQYAGGALVFGFTLADTPPHEVQGRCEYLVWINDLSRGPTFINHPSFPRDPAIGTNVSFGLGINPEGQGSSSTFTLDLEKSGGFLFDPTPDVRSFVTPNFVGISVPKNQIGELASVNFYTFCAEEGSSFAAEDSGADQTGLIDVTFDDAGLLAVTELVATTTSTTLADSTTTLHVTPSAAGPSGVVDVEEPGGGLPWWLFIVGGGALALIAWWLFARGEGDPCKELLKALTAAQRAYAEAQQTADKTEKDCLEAEDDLEDKEKARREACKAWPPACWSTPEGSWMEDGRGNRITAWDVHMRKTALGDVWSDYKAGKLTATEVEDRWRELDTPEFREEMRERDETFRELVEGIDADLEKAKKAFEEACDRADEAQARADEARAVSEAARKAYEECVATARPPDAS